MENTQKSRLATGVAWTREGYKEKSRGIASGFVMEIGSCYVAKDDPEPLSCLHLPDARITGMDLYTQFMQYWRLHPGHCAE